MVLVPRPGSLKSHTRCNDIVNQLKPRSIGSCHLHCKSEQSQITWDSLDDVVVSFGISPVCMPSACRTLYSPSVKST